MSNLMELAPAILGFLGGPAGGLAGAGLEWLASKFGASEATAASIKETLQGMKPEDTIALRKIDIEFQEFCLANGIKLNLAQIAVNQEEAKSLNVFVAGWRPFIGWTCGAAFAWQFVVLPFIGFFVFTFGTAAMVIGLAKAPALDFSAMAPVLLGMLGLAGMRTYEKENDVNDKHG